MRNPIQRLKAFTRQDAPDFVDLIRGVFTLRLMCILTATVTVAGGVTSGTLLTEHLLRTAEVEVVWDGTVIVPRTPAYWWAALTKRKNGGAAPRYSGLANADAQTATSVSAYFEIPFARPWLMNPVETALPPLPVGQMLQFRVYWSSTANAAAGSENGSGSMIVGGDRVVTFPTDPVMEVYQEYTPTAGTPVGIPVYSFFNSAQFTAANTQFTHDIRSSRIFDAILVRAASNAEKRLQDGINAFSLSSAQAQHIVNKSYNAHHFEEASNYPGVSQAGADDLGYLFYLAADGGKLTNAVDPRTLQNFQFSFDVDAPTTNPGVLEFLHSELLPYPGLTRLEA